MTYQDEVLKIFISQDDEDMPEDDDVDEDLPEDDADEIETEEEL